MSGNTPLRFLGVGDLLDREYRNSPAYQWGRELARNGIEANASTIRFGVEWEGVKATGTYRLQYADDGHGMTKDDLRDYMLTLGRGGKVVGGPHDHYALGSRMTLLPWNPHGVVVISMTDGEPYMVKMMFDRTAADGDGEYVLQEVAWAEEDGKEGLATVYPPYDDRDLGFDWADTLPDFVKKATHGTTFTLLGKTPSDHTIEGDPDRLERHRYLGRKYFNTRFWTLPDGVTLQVIEMPEERNDWPKSPSDGHTQNRTVRGAKSLVEYTKSTGEQFIGSNGVVPLADGTMVHWWLRTEQKVDTGGLGAASGYIAVLYRGELYSFANADQEDGDTRIGAAVYRQFGIGSDIIRRRLFLIIEPPEYDEVTGSPGVAPSTGRADLYWMGAGGSPRSVKPADWSEEFGSKLPKEILDAIDAEYKSRDTHSNRDERLKRVVDRFSKRWKATRARIQEKDADTTTTPTGTGSPQRAPIDSPTPARRTTLTTKRVIVRRRPGEASIGQPGTGTTPAKTVNVSAGVPDCRWVTEADINDKGMMAAWQKPSAKDPNGCVELDQGHPVILSQIEYWQKQYPPAVANEVKRKVMEAYEEVAVAKVSHMHALTGPVISEEQRNDMLLNPALTTSLLGLISEDALISPRLGALGTKKRAGAEETDSSAA